MRCILTRKSLRVFCLLWLCLLLGLLCATVCSAEQTYRITDQELTQLETNLATLKINNNKQQKELQNLLIQLNESKVLQQQTQTSLDNANKYLAEYGKEVKARERRLKRQKNIAYAITGILTYVLIKKH